jgi:hypothetical protein
VRCIVNDIFVAVVGVVVVVVVAMVQVTSKRGIKTSQNQADVTTSDRPNVQLTVKIIVQS